MLLVLKSLAAKSKEEGLVIANSDNQSLSCLKNSCSSSLFLKDSDYFRFSKIQDMDHHQNSYLVLTCSYSGVSSSSITSYQLDSWC